MRKFLPPALLPILSAGLFIALLVPLAGRADLPVVQHDIQANIDPDAGHLAVIDRLTLPPGRDTADFLLHAGMAPRVRPGEGTLEVLGRDGDLETLRLRLSPDATSAAIAYEGTIRNPLDAISEGMGRERQVSAGTIGPDGVFLDGNSGWYPRVPGTLQRFRLKVSLPAGWQAVSQGAGPDGDPATQGACRLCLGGVPTPGRHLSDRRALSRSIAITRPGSSPRSGCGHLTSRSPPAISPPPATIWTSTAA